MAKFGKVLLLIIVVFGFVAYKINSLFEIPATPKLEDTWWGPSDPSKEDTDIKQFKIQFTNESLTDLKHRLDIAKAPFASLENTNQEYGMNSQLLGTILDYWKSKYNWRERENFLNQYPQFTVSIQGLRIHYLHVKPKNTEGKKIIPLLLLHGWPGSVREFYETIPHLIKPQQIFSFELIIPSLPGFGFSEAPVRPGMGSIEIAVIFKNFMQRLGFHKYYIQGGDAGAVIAQHMATLFPDKVAGVHSNFCASNTPKANLLYILGNFFPTFVADEKESAKMYPLSEKFMYLLLEFGYMHIQSTKPDTIGTVLRDTPVGLAAYILEKFTTWTNPTYNKRREGALEEKFSFDKLLDNVMIYWISDSILTSVRLYSESLNKKQMTMGVDSIPTNVAFGCARFSHELIYFSKTILKEKFTNLIHVSDYDGGHFAALEVPGVLSKDVIDFVKKAESMLNVETKDQ